MKIEYLITYPPTVEQYRQFLLGELRRMEDRAQVEATQTVADIQQVRHRLLQRQQPILDELARIHSIHAQPNLIICD